ncbi:hypothetical protein M3Y99_01821600 [Aphelenchoides fujianensis]|nr:hypothetical protein M3Y99_01821600 [Aphelenchoides fujianensis]
MRRRRPGFHYGGSPAETAVGFAVLLFACVCFGTMFLPLKRVDCGDGFFVQFVECAAVFVFGFVVNVVRRLPKFNLIAALGGVLYATGNCASVPIIQSELGVGLGMLIWTTVQVVEGWGVGRFGLLGTHRQEVRSEPLNYAGIALSLLSGLLFVFVRSGREDEAKRAGGWRSNFSRTKLFYIGLSVFLGCLHGLMLTPVVYVQENDRRVHGQRARLPVFLLLRHLPLLHALLRALRRREARPAGRARRARAPVRALRRRVGGRHDELPVRERRPLANHHVADHRPAARHHRLPDRRARVQNGRRPPQLRAPRRRHRGRRSWASSSSGSPISSDRAGNLHPFIASFTTSLSLSPLIPFLTSFDHARPAAMPLAAFFSRISTRIAVLLVLMGVLGLLLVLYTLFECAMVVFLSARQLLRKSKAGEPAAGNNLESTGQPSAYTSSCRRKGAAT